MPNTLCHIGLQAPLNGIFLKKHELIWVVIACVIPDIPWVELKLLLATHTINPYDLRLYCTAQASLLFCLVLSCGLCLFSHNSPKVFILLGINSLFHLLLDSLQIKWGNGVNIISPINWEMFHLDLFWPEYTGTLVLTVLGFIYLIYNWSTIRGNNPLQLSTNKSKYAFGSLFIALYLIGPLYFVSQLDDANTYFIHTMRHTEERAGKSIKLDRAHYFADSQEVKIYSGERLKLTGNLPPQSGRVSFSGVFQDSKTITSQKYHLHTDYRDFASLIGLFMACTLVLHSLVLGKINSDKTHLG
ncbi:MAG: hypothetical protein ACI8ZB_002331 [Desulforhopalus sp.]